MTRYDDDDYDNDMMTMTRGENKMEKIVALAKRRGFIFPGSEIYGGLAGTWDYGPLGVELKNNIKREWWNAMVVSRDDVYAIDSAILMNRKVWEASEHIGNFTDPMIDCKKCKHRFRVDQVDLAKGCSECGARDFTDVRPFNMMFETRVGAVEDTAEIIYLRPETAQGIFTNFKNVLDTFHPVLPFGIAQIGKAFRNEITPSNFLFRAREFEQMELEYFIPPDEQTKWFEYWEQARLKWFLNLGISQENIRLRRYDKEELAHYARATTDIEYRFPFTNDFKELEGIANRGDFDLNKHIQISNANLRHYEERTETWTIPVVIEPSLGVDRAVFAFLSEAYREEEKRIVLKLHPRLAPYKAAVFPLLANKPQLVEKARAVYTMLREDVGRWPGAAVAWDDRGNIGKRYYAQDEIGTPWCITVDFQTLEDDTVTIRDRDTAKQDEKRIAVKELSTYLQKKI